jgi:hypothetical protein
MDIKIMLPGDHRPQSSSASRVTAGALGFLTFNQCAAKEAKGALGRLFRWGRLVDQRRFAVLHGLLGQFEPRLRHRKKRYPTLGVGHSLGDLDAISCVQLISRQDAIGTQDSNNDGHFN